MCSYSFLRRFSMSYSEESCIDLSEGVLILSSSSFSSISFWRFAGRNSFSRTQNSWREEIFDDVLVFSNSVNDDLLASIMMEYISEDISLILVKSGTMPELTASTTFSGSMGWNACHSVKSSNKPGESEREREMESPDLHDHEKAEKNKTQTGRVKR